MARKTTPSLPPCIPEAEAKPRYTVIRDTREKEGQGWTFGAGTSCKGTVRRKLDTGDYAVEGLETRFTIDRKGSVAEFAANVFQARFARELDRMDTFDLAIILLEFEYSDIIGFPGTSDIPRSRWKYLRVTPHSFQRRLWELQLQHPRIHFLFAGTGGKEAADSLFKRVFHAYGK